MPEKINLEEYKIGANAQRDAARRINSHVPEAQEILTHLAPKRMPRDEKENSSDDNDTDGNTDSK